MKSIDLSIKNLKSFKNNLSICLGYFDGIHIGHKKILECCSLKAKYEKAILTFSEPISNYIDNNKSKEILTSLTDRFRISSRYDLDYFIIFHIDKDFLNLSPLEYIDILKKMNVKEIFCGCDYRFGKSASGDINLLKQFFDVNVVDLYSVNGNKVSTQEIINKLKEGNIKTANELLGQHYQICGTVVSGHHNGEKFNIRTANIKFDANYVVPLFGVYKVIIYIDNRPYLAIANIGVHPTIDKEEKPILEVHIPSFNENIYGKNVYVEFLDFIRKEKKFETTNELINQINSDMKVVGLL